MRYQEDASDAIDQLRPGDELALEPEPDNPIDPNAVLVTADGTRLGWVPNPLLTYVRAVVSLPNARLIVFVPILANSATTCNLAASGSRRRT